MSHLERPLKEPAELQNEAERLTALKGYDILDTLPETAFDHIVWLAAHTLGVPIAAINFVDEQRQWSKACVGTLTLTGEREYSFCAHVVQAEEVVVIPDAHEDPRFKENPYVTGEPGIHFYAGAPITTPDGHVLGSLCAIDRKPRTFSHDDQEVLERLAALVTSELALRLTRKTLHDEQQQLERTAQAAQEALDRVLHANQQTQQARNSEARYRALVEATSEIVWTTPPSGEFETDQPAWRAFTGQVIEDSRGWGWVSAVHPEDRDGIIQGWTEAHQTLTHFQTDLRLRRHDGKYRSMHVSAAPVLDDDGTLREWVGVLTDVTERKHAEQQLRQRTRALEHANHELEAFTSSVSHDLRTPVRHISTFLTLARRALGDQPDGKVDKYLSVAEDAASRMDTLIKALLTLSKTAMQPLSVGPVSLAELVEQTRKDLELEVMNRNVRWEVTALPIVLGDPDTLRQVLMNLLSNAVKYTQQRETAVIQVWSEDHPEEWAVFVRDNGAGFDPQHHERLFEVFQRLHHAQEFPGVGVGLSNVRRVIQRHGGRVWAQGKPGEGATFGFTLPKHP